MSGMIKISEVVDGLRQSAQSLRDSVTGEAHSRSKLAQAQRFGRAEELVTMAQDKHVDLAPLLGDASGHHEKVAHLADRDDLDRVEYAVKLAAGDLSFGQVEEAPRTASDHEPSSRAESNYIASLLGDDDV